MFLILHYSTTDWYSEISFYEVMYSQKSTKLKSYSRTALAQNNVEQIDLETKKDIYQMQLPTASPEYIFPKQQAFCQAT